MPIALVTGPTSGVGHAFAEALAREGHDLVLVSRDAARLAAVAERLSADHGVGCEVLPADLSRIDDTERVEARLRGERFDVLVNNAGFGQRRAFHDNDVEAEQRGLDVLVRAVMRLSHAALGPMIRAGRGDIVNVSSVAGFLPRGTYGAHKAWVTSFSAWAGVRYRTSGVRVIAVCPGLVRTEFHERQGATLRAPGWMWLEADEVAQTALTDLRKGKAVCVPTARYKFLVGLARIAPRPVAERVSRSRR